MKYITAVRKSSDVYDVFYSDDASFDPYQSLDYAERVAKKYGYKEIRTAAELFTHLSLNGWGV